jgi:hypothetical protein
MHKKWTTGQAATSGLCLQLPLIHGVYMTCPTFHVLASVVMSEGGLCNVVKAKPVEKLKM